MILHTIQHFRKIELHGLWMLTSGSGQESEFTIHILVMPSPRSVISNKSSGS
jgi:hypothetical protein